MLHKPLISLGILLVSGAVVGQGTVAPAPVIGSAADVQGLVTVSDGKTIASVINGNSLVDGSRVVTSSTGSVTLKTNSGCNIRLGPNQSITLLRERSCEALVASIQLLPGEYMISARTVIAAGAAVLTGALLLSDSGGAAPAQPGSGGPIPDPISVQ